MHQLDAQTIGFEQLIECTLEDIAQCPFTLEYLAFHFNGQSLDARTIVENDNAIRIVKFFFLFEAFVYQAPLW